MATRIECPIWKTAATLVSSGDYGRQKAVISPRAGGKYALTATVEAVLQSLDDDDRLKITTWIVDQNRFGEVPAALDSNDLNQIGNRRKLSVLERRHRLIEFLNKRLLNIGQDVQVSGNMTEEAYRDRDSMFAWTESLDMKEVRYLIDSCEQEELIEKTRNGVGIRLTAKAYERLSQFDKGNASSSQAFVAMWFDPSLADAYSNGFNRAVEETGYKPLRIDLKEHVNKIDDEIISEIRQSRFVIADFTARVIDKGSEEIYEARGGVYFEAGFALGLDIPVI